MFDMRLWLDLRHVARLPTFQDLSGIPPVGPIFYQFLSKLARVMTNQFLVDMFPKSKFVAVYQMETPTKFGSVYRLLQLVKNSCDHGIGIDLLSMYLRANLLQNDDHFLRGALYFNTATQNDFLAPQHCQRGLFLRLLSTSENFRVVFVVACRQCPCFVL